MNPEMKKALEELRASIAAFQQANDERLKQIEAKGSADPLTEQEVAALNKRIDAAQEAADRAEKQARTAETAANRAPVGAVESGTVPVAVHARNFFAQMRRVPADSIQVGAADVESFQNYRRGLLAYLRQGENGLAGELRNAMSVGSDPNGGYFVTPDMSGRIVELIYETSAMRQLADVQPISTDSLKGRYDNDQAEAGWVGETAARPVTTTPTLGNWEIFAREMYANPSTTQQLLDDSAVNVEDWLSRKVSTRFGRLEETAYFSGDGVSAPRGILTYTAGTPTSSTFNVIEQFPSGAAGAFATTKPGDKLIDMVFGLKAAYRANAKWIMPRSAVSLVRQLKDGQGNYLWTMNFENRQGGLLLGYPIVEAEDMEAVAANSLSLAFGDFRAGYQIVDRQGIRVLRDPYTSKPNVLFYTTRRVGGAVVNFEAIKLMKMATAV